jgi:hypothetical protein
MQLIVNQRMAPSAVNEHPAKFPVITFRKKRLTVAITAQFDMEHAEDVAVVRQMVEEALSHLVSEGQAKVSYSVVDV